MLLVWPFSAGSAQGEPTLNVANSRSVPRIDETARGLHAVTDAVRGCLRRATVGHLWLRYAVDEDGALRDIVVEVSTLSRSESRCVERALPEVRYPSGSPATVRVQLRTGSHRALVREVAERGERDFQLVTATRSGALGHHVSSRRDRIERCVRGLLDETFIIFEAFFVHSSSGTVEVTPAGEPRTVVYNRFRGRDRTTEVATCLQDSLRGAPSGNASIVISAVVDGSLL